jgi:hypothetical protein
MWKNRVKLFVQFHGNSKFEATIQFFPESISAVDEGDLMISTQKENLKMWNNSITQKPTLFGAHNFIANSKAMHSTELGPLST